VCTRSRIVWCVQGRERTTDTCHNYTERSPYF
jgi:hypothetical protein